MAAEDRLLLCCGAIEVEITPAKGGAILRFDCNYGNQRLHILRPAPHPLSDILGAANFPLVPFVNRIRGGRFSFRGREVQLKTNLVNDPSPLHGQGWLAAWRVVHADEREAELIFDHLPGEWPWAYQARQHFLLDEAGLTLQLTCRNTDSEPMPCGLGLHPYFRCTAETRLATNVSDAWTIDDKVLPVDKVPATGRYDLADRLICGQDLDNGFAGWGGIARITDPALPFAIELTSPDAHFFQVYSPPSGGLFVAEPVSHANAALNEPEERWAELGLRVLEAGEEMSLTMRLAISPAGPASPAS